LLGRRASPLPQSCDHHRGDWFRKLAHQAFQSALWNKSMHFMVLKLDLTDPAYERFAYLSTNWLMAS